jgi:hypothetical protein
MSGLAMEETKAKAPWHLWVIGILAVLWNSSGAYTIVMAQQGMLAGVSAGEAAYYAAQLPWFVAVTDVALLGGILGGLALLLRSRMAVVLFAISLVAIVATNGYDLAMGTSRMFTNTTTVMVTCLIWVLAIVQFLYAMAMKKHGVLR